MRVRCEFIHCREKQCAAIGGLGEPLACVARFTLALAILAEQFGLDHAVRAGAAVDHDKRPVAASTAVVDSAGEQFLAGTRFAGNQHGHVDRGDFLHVRDGRAHGGAVADQRRTRVVASDVVFQCGALPLIAAFGQRAFDEQQELLVVEGFADVVDGTFANGVNG